MTEISQKIDSSSASQYSFGPHGPDLAALRSLDKRLELSDNTILFLNQNLSNADRTKLFKYLKAFFLSADDVEKVLRIKWNIPQTIKKIKVLIPGNFNNAFAGNDKIDLLIGKPKEYDNFFASPISLYAHEQGHVLTCFDENGMADAGELSIIESFNIIKRSLGSDGKLKRKYFEDIPYNCLPGQLLFPEKTVVKGLLYFVNELIADKVALQVCGEKDMGIYVKAKIERIAAKDPWEYLFCIALSREFKLGSEEKVLRHELGKLDCPWESFISTEELLNMMSEFFRQVSLKHQ